jgi:hypothetical protein
MSALFLLNALLFFRFFFHGNLSVDDVQRYLVAIFIGNQNGVVPVLQLRAFLDSRLASAPGVDGRNARPPRQMTSRTIEYNRFGSLRDRLALGRQDAPGLVFQFVELVIVAGREMKAPAFATHDVLFAKPERGASRRVGKLFALHHELLRHHLHMHLTASTVRACGSADAIAFQDGLLD